MVRTFVPKCLLGYKKVQFRLINIPPLPQKNYLPHDAVFVAQKKLTVFPKKSPRYANNIPFTGIPTSAYNIINILPKRLVGEMLP
jgi:hypothetical protein